MSSGTTETSVASSSLTRDTIWLPAVLARPRVATNAATPKIVPRAVSKVRAGRAVMASDISEARSAKPNCERGDSRAGSVMKRGAGISAISVVGSSPTPSGGRPPGGLSVMSPGPDRPLRPNHLEFAPHVPLGRPPNRRG